MSGWMKCSVRMPEEGKTVFWWNEEAGFGWIGCYATTDNGMEAKMADGVAGGCVDGWSWALNDIPILDDDVGDSFGKTRTPSHWHPLPELPKSGKERR